MSVHFNPGIGGAAGAPAGDPADNNPFRFIGRQIQKVCNTVHDTVLTPEFVSNVKGAVKVIAGDYGLLLGAGSNIVKGLQGVGAVAQDSGIAKNLLSIAGIVLGALQLLPTAFSLEELVSLREDMLTNIPSPKPLDLRERRIQDLTNSCNFVIGKEKPIRKTLGLAKETKIHQMAQRIKDALQSEDFEVQNQALGDGEKLMQELRNRVNMKFGIETAKLAVRTTGVALSVISLFTGPTPPTLIAFGAVGIATIALYVFEKVMLPKDPFSTPRDVWYEQAGDSFRKGVYKVNDTVAETSKQIGKIVSETSNEVYDKANFVMKDFYSLFASRL